MTHFMFPMSLLALAILCVSGSGYTDLEISTVPENENIVSGLTVTILCTWTPNGLNAEAVGVVLTADADGEDPIFRSVMVDELYAEDSRVTFNEGFDGVTTFIIIGVTTADKRKFKCTVVTEGGGTSETDDITLNIIGYLTVGVTDLQATSDATTVTVTFTEVEEATRYLVCIALTVETGRAESWICQDITVTEHTFTGLERGTSYTVRVSAANAVGINSAIAPAHFTIATAVEIPN